MFLSASMVFLLSYTDIVWNSYPPNSNNSTKTVQLFLTWETFVNKAMNRCENESTKEVIMSNIIKFFTKNVEHVNLSRSYNIINKKVLI